MRLLAALVSALAATSTPGKAAARLFVLPLDARPGVAAETDVDLTLPGATRSVDFLVPAGYTIDLGARTGTVVGTARTAGASTLVVAAPGRWQATGIAVSVDRLDDGGYRLACKLAQPVGEVDLDIERGLTNPPGGVFTWQADVSGGAEARSVLAFPQRLTAKATLGRGVLRVSGTLTVAGRPRVGVNVHVAVAGRDDFADARELGIARTSADGAYALRRPLKASASHLSLIAYVDFYAGSCSGACVEETIAPPPARLVAVAPG